MLGIFTWAAVPARCWRRCDFKITLEICTICITLFEGCAGTVNILATVGKWQLGY